MSPDYSTIQDMLDRGGMLNAGHFSFQSGVHSTALIDRDLLLADPGTASRFGYTIAKAFFTDHVDTIATPSIWGAGLSQWVGYFLDPRANIVVATRTRDQLTIAEKLLPLVRGKRVLLVDNMVLSGQTMDQFLHALREMGAHPIGIATLWNAGPAEIGGVTVTGILNAVFPAYPPDDCPACAEGLSVHSVPF